LLTNAICCERANICGLSNLGEEMKREDMRKVFKYLRNSCHRGRNNSFSTAPVEKDILSLNFSKRDLG